MNIRGRVAAQVPVISLFSGAGGLDLGVEDAGGDIAVCVEPDADCVSTLRSNRRFFPHAAIIDRPLETVTTEELLHAAGVRRRHEVALLVGGPPCQPFSKSGYWLQGKRRGIEDPRAALIQQYLRVLNEARPAAFIFENVASFTHPTHREAFDSLIASANELGYSVDWRLLHAAEFGVPQTRSRVFVLGLRGRAAPRFPLATHWWHNQATNGHRLRPPETAGNWIAHLNVDDLCEPEEKLTGKWIHHLREIPPGWNYKFHTAWAGHHEPTFVTETKYWTFLLKLSPHRPSWTIQASAGPWTGPLHWENRRLRVPELAALQTFPGTYEFTGSRRSRVRQIGNAVPSLLASKVTAELLGQVLGTKPRRGRRLRYRLSRGFPFRESTMQHSGHRW